MACGRDTELGVAGLRKASSKGNLPRDWEYGWALAS